MTATPFRIVAPRGRPAISVVARMIDVTEAALGNMPRKHRLNLVGVGCRKMVVGSRLGTLLGPFRPTPTCAI